ncbi:urea ABC transporter permease subunit UrtB [Roseimicrobium gellanilyticum]|uniref:urea ABC transporter permease subunit UrtB n=1 Tax=Roseimicrobium gellanilyticum TaxID=748857 RepID=UPI001FED13D6|nr:urea ABC transporter permease subunit UrtB [Roseimicrobium gellanilyticum]
MKALSRLLSLTLISGLLCSVSLLAETPRETIAKAALNEDSAKKREIITTLVGQGDEVIKTLMDDWKADKLFIHTTAAGEKVVVRLQDDKDDAGTQSAVRVDDGATLKDASGSPLRLVAKEQKAVEHDRGLRNAMKAVLDLLDLSSPDAKKRIQAVETLGAAQNAEKLPALEARAKVEQDPEVLRELKEAAALINLKNSSDDVKVAALKDLKELHAFSSYDLIKATLKEAETASKAPVVSAAKDALAAIDSHRTFVDFFGTIFRGISTGSILLIAALGLAITFGLMGVINMAHGEMIAVGAYTTYIVQNIFGAGVTIPLFGLSLAIPGMHATGAWYNSYFLFAIPASFFTAALVGIALERGIIQFLYRRPLESLLATWGVSLLLQQVFRLTFGANNVQVGSPSWLSGNWTISDIIFNWNRVFVIGFAIFIVFGTYLVLTKTSLGLLMRAVMQNRNMAACMGIRTSRVNMLTFGFGSGLAGLAGAFLSQITNTGPSLGQSYIVECFMTVVVGGVGNIAGTVTSAVGIGMADQSIQQILLNPVMGKILVLVGIILFLQWRPAGIFVTRSRSLD